MRTLSVQEARQSLGDWLRRAANGEEIAITEGRWTVLLQPIAQSQGEDATWALSAREALCQLQSQARLTSAEAEDYLRQVRAERLTEGRRTGQ